MQKVQRGEDLEFYNKFQIHHNPFQMPVNGCCVWDLVLTFYANTFVVCICNNNSM